MSRTEFDLLNALSLGEAETPDARGVYAGIQRGVRRRRRNRTVGAGLMVVVAVLVVAALPALSGLGRGLPGGRPAEGGLLAGRVDDAARARDLAVLVKDSAGLVHELQNERAAAALLLGERARQLPTRHEAAGAFDRQAPYTTMAAAGYSKSRAALTSPPGLVRNLLDKIDEQIADLSSTRDKVKTDDGASLTPVVFNYKVLIANLLSLRDSAAQLAGDEELGADMRAAAALAQAKECIAQERVVGIRALVDGKMPAELRREYLASRVCRDQAKQEFDIVANQDQMTLFNEVVTGSDERESAILEAAFDALRTDELRPTVDFTVPQWDAAMVGRASLFRTVESKIDERIVTAAGRNRSAAEREVRLQRGAVAGAVVLVLALLVIAWFVGRAAGRRRARSASVPAWGSGAGRQPTGVGTDGQKALGGPGQGDVEGTDP